MFVIEFSRFAARTLYGSGDDPNGTVVATDVIKIESDNLKSLLQKILDFFHVDNEQLDIDGQIHVTRLETEDGNQMTASQRIAWVNGTLPGWDAVYSGAVKNINEVRIEILRKADDVVYVYGNKDGASAEFVEIWTPERTPRTKENVL